MRGLQPVVELPMSRKATSDVSLQTNPPSLASIAPLATNIRKSRIGVAYVRSVCAQAGVGFAETSPDEDAIAVDGLVTFRQLEVRVQIKCTSKIAIDAESASWHIEPRWAQKWSESWLPVFLVLVIVDPQELRWLEHHAGHTVLRAAAYWGQVNDLQIRSQNLPVPKANRLTRETFLSWKDLARDCFLRNAEGAA
jgi:hypothetical protein